jgi:tetratricopeptide (TPR) repeat protein
MKPNIHLLLLGLLLTNTLTAQNPENNKILRGKVLFQNSNFTPATGVAVSGIIKVEKEEYANKNYTDSKGQYELKFPLARKGHPVKLTIGNTDKTGQELEVVNEKEISLCRIPANANEEFEVIVCPKGARDVAARKYYKILKNSAEKAYAQMQQEFRALTEAQNKDYNSIQQVADDLTKLQEQIYDSIAIYKEAMAIASINKDGVNERVLNYLKLLDEGKSIQEARKELSISKASNDMEKGITLFRAGVKELEERARASAAVFDYKDAVICYDTLIAKAEKLNIDQLELSGYYLEAGELDRKAGHYQKSLQLNKKTVEIRERLLDSLDTKLAVCYNNLATIYLGLGLHEKALLSLQKALYIFESASELDIASLATTYNNLAMIYSHMGNFEKALTIIENALSIREAILEINHPDIATCYNNLATIYQNLGQYEKALTKQQRALNMDLFRSDAIRPDIAYSFNNLAMIYQDLRKLDEALIAQNKAITIYEAVLGVDHHLVASAYNNLATIFKDKGEYEKALDAQQNALHIFEIVFEENHPLIATCYNNLALIYTNLVEYEKALIFQKKSLNIFEAILRSNHPSIATSYNNLGILYYRKNELPKSVYYLQKALTIRIKTLSKIHPKTQQVFKDLLFIQKQCAKKHFFESNYQQALISLDTVTKYQKDAEAWNYKGQCHYNLKQYPNAITSYQKAVAIDTTLKTQHYYDNIGTAYTKNHQFPEAKAAFTQYQKLFPKESKPYRNWAMYYALQNQKEEALENLKKAIAIGYKDLQWLETDDSMENIRNEPGFKALLEQLKE